MVSITLTVPLAKPDIPFIAAEKGISVTWTPSLPFRPLDASRRRVTSPMVAPVILR